MKLRIPIFLVLVLCFSSVFAQEEQNTDPPEGYYAGTDGLKGSALKLRLHQIIRNHKVRAYSEFRDTILPDLDEDPNNPDNIILFYKNNSIPKANFANGDDDWNREHTWPSSHGFPDTFDTTYTDAHNLRPSDATVNSSKSNKDFDDIENTAENEQGEAPDTYTNSDFWEPRDEIKGDVARILFYMDVRYESSRLDLSLVERATFSGDPELGVLYTLIKWHEADPVDEAERTRHEGVFGYQENRNPFVDHPEWVAEVFGSATDPLLVVDEANFNRDFGFVEQGNELAQTYKLNAFNLNGDVSVKVNSPFSVSIDGTNWTDSIGFTDDGSESQLFDINLRFLPEAQDETSTAEVLHYTDGDTVSFTVSGQEGEQSVISIAEARSKALGEVVSVTGVVVDAGNNSSNSRILFDGEAGIVVRSFDAGNESSNLNQGDSVLVRGGLSEFNNLLQIEESPITIEVLKSDVALPDPDTLLLSEIGEAYEAQLVRVEGVSFEETGTFQGGGSAGNFTITDGTNDLVFRIGSSSHPLVGTDIPSGIYNITGFVGQFGDDYQLSVRTQDDLEFVSDGGNTEVPDLMSIAEARNLEIGSVTHVTGVVISQGNNSADNRVIYDGTAGIVVRSFDDGNESAPLIEGDSVVVIGGISEFNGTLQIEESPISINVVAQGVTLPEPEKIEVSEVSEEYESELVTLDEVEIVESGRFERGNYTIEDGEASLILRIGLSDHPLVGESIPEGPVSLTGYIGQFQDDYQLFLRNETDLEILTAALGLEASLHLDLVYPNPATDFFEILNGKTTEVEEVSIFDMNGRLAASFTEVKEKISVETLDNGIYLVYVKTSSQNFYGRLVVNR